MFLGIEIGGTKLQLGVGRGDGTLAGLWRGEVDVAAGGAGIRARILAAVPELLAQSGIEREHIAGAGIGFGGPVDDFSASTVKSHQIDCWDKFPLAAWVTEQLGWPAALGNDADVAGLAEALFGAGRGLTPIFYITIGSGIGGGLIIDGEIYRGCGRGAAEIGHLQVTSLALAKAPRARLEDVASGWAIAEEARTRAWLLEETASWNLLAQVDGNRERITAADVGELAARQDPFAWGVLQPAWESLAEAICHVIALLCPRRIVIGGGVSLMGEEVLFKPLRKLVAERVFEPFASCYDIVPATLGEEVVVHGALALARRRVNQSSGG
jgi:glucokinase